MKYLKNTIKENFNIFIISIIFVFLSFLIGFFMPQNVQYKWIDFVKKYISNIQFNVFNIFLNNIFVSLLIIVGGLIFCLPSFILIGINFFSLGILMRFFLSVEKLRVFIISLLPHSIFELPAIFISLLFGIKVFKLFYIEKHKFDSFFLDKIKKYILIAILLFLIAAIIEVYITPIIILNFLKADFTF
ncbi:MAG: stage II sporulation protein M [Brevinematia bacterium]|mgnify:CR=1 FL=1